MSGNIEFPICGKEGTRGVNHHVNEVQTKDDLERIARECGYVSLDYMKAAVEVFNRSRDAIGVPPKENVSDDSVYV